MTGNGDDAPKPAVPNSNPPEPDSAKSSSDAPTGDGKGGAKAPAASPKPAAPKAPAVGPAPKLPPAPGIGSLDLPEALKRGQTMDPKARLAALKKKASGGAPAAAAPLIPGGAPRLPGGSGPGAPDIEREPPAEASLPEASEPPASEPPASEPAASETAASETAASETAASETAASETGESHGEADGSEAQGEGDDSATDEPEPEPEPAAPGHRPVALPKFGASSRRVMPASSYALDPPAESADPEDDEGPGAAESSGATPAGVDAMDTMALLADIADELGANEPTPEDIAAASTTDAPRAAGGAPAPGDPIKPPPMAATDDDWAPRTPTNPKLLWAAAAGAALFVILGISMCGDDDAPEDAVAATDTEPSAAAPTPAPETEEVEAPADAADADDAHDADEVEAVEDAEAIEEPELVPDLPSEPAEEVEEVEEAEVEEAPQESAASSSGSSRKKKQRKKATTATAEPAPAAAPKSEPKPAAKPAAEPASKSSAQLLQEAKRALTSGSASKAYSLASQAYKAGGGSDAGEVMVEAACKMGSASKASSALAKVGVFKRARLKRLCKDLGVKI